jgi:deoxyribonuclease V
MTKISTHRWDVSFQEAISIQKRLAKEVSLRTSARLKKRLEVSDLLIGGADISYNRHSSILYAVVLVMRLDELMVLEKSVHSMEVSFPYVPGLLSFREVPPIMEAFSRLKRKPDVMLCDGQGRAHPRRFGLACHLGVLLGLPTIGCAKSRLVGSYHDPGYEKGCFARLIDKGEVVGRVVRTRNAVKPLYVSVGNKVGLDDAVRIILNCTKRYRIPEPIRQAHMEVNYLRKSLS